MRHVPVFISWWSGNFEVLKGFLEVLQKGFERDDVATCLVQLAPA
jgi:hypothetical protein